MCMKVINDKEFRTPGGNEYDSAVEKSIRRRQRHVYNNGMLSTGSKYVIENMTYKVRSIFNTESSNSSEEGLKRLMVQDVEKVS